MCQQQGKPQCGIQQGHNLCPNSHKQGAMFHSPWDGDLMAFCKTPKVGMALCV